MTRERLHVLDILRGFALLGMILVHFHQTMEREVTGVEDLIGWFTYIFVETKSWGVFAFLFGTGFAILLGRLEARGAPVVRVYLRRLFGLAVFGFIAEAFFGFHILLEYAIWGVPLLLIRDWPARTLLALALVVVMLRPAAFALRELTPPAQTAAETNPAEALRAAEESEDYGTVLRARLGLMRLKYTSIAGVLPGSSFVLFIIGLLALRRGVFHEPRRHARLIFGWMAFGFCSWGLWWLFNFFPPPLPWWAASAFGVIADQWLCFTYIGAIVLLVAWWPAWSSRLAAFGIAGRMALTNYLLQCAILDLLASNYAFGITIRPLMSLAATALLFGALVAFSAVWLSRFRYGPLEWLWRCFTWSSWQPLRIERQPAEAV